MAPGGRVTGCAQASLHREGRFFAGGIGEVRAFAFVLKAAHELGDDCTGKVWYEWMLDVDGVTSPIHNPLGRSNWIGL